MGDEKRPERPEICISIDVERDYRLDRRVTVRGIAEGLPVYLDALHSLEIPHDLFVSGEVVAELSSGVFGGDGLAALGSHGLTHEPGVRSYLNRKTRPIIEHELQKATEHIRSRFGRSPSHFRAPNLSTSAQTISVLERLGYRSDSSILPGRHVRRWRTLPLLDHRNAPLDPYHPDPLSILQQGSSSILEIPVTPNPFQAGSPLGLGFLHHAGLESFIRAIAHLESRYVILLAHSWEMVSWRRQDSVEGWVPQASSSSPNLLQGLVERFGGSKFVNMDRILAQVEDRAIGNPG